MLAFAGCLALEYRAHHSYGGVARRHHVRLLQGGAHRRAVRFPGGVQKATYCLSHEVAALIGAVGSGPAKGGYGHDDNPGIERPQSIVAQAEVIETARREVLHQDVAPGDKPDQRLPAIVRAGVQRHAALVGVVGQKLGALPVAGRALQERRLAPRRVARGRLNLHHVRALVRQELGAEGAGRRGAQLHHADVFQYACQVPFLSLSGLAASGRFANRPYVCAAAIAAAARCL